MSKTVDQYISELKRYLKAGNSADANLIIEELCKLGQRDISIENVSLGSKVELEVESLNSLNFRNCTFNELFLKNGTINDINFIECYFHDKIGFTDISVLTRINFHQNMTKISHLIFSGVTSKPKLSTIAISFSTDRGFLENLTLENALIKVALPNTIAPQGQLKMSSCEFMGDFSQFFSFHPSMRWTIHNCTFEEKFFNIGDRSLKTPLHIKDSTFKKGVSFKGISFQENLVIENCISISEGLVMQNCNFFKGSTISGKFSSIEIASGKSDGLITIIGDKSIITDKIHIETLFSKSANLTLQNINVNYLTLISKDSSTSDLGLHSLKINSANVKMNFIKGLSVKDVTEVENSIFKSSKFEGCKFSGPTHFKSTKFETAPLFDHCEMFFDTSFKTSYFLDKSSKSEGAYRQLKHKMSLINNDVESGRFASYEIRARMKGLGISDWFELLMSFIYYLINRCGNSLLQPFIWILVLGIGFSYIYREPNSILFSIPKEMGQPGATWHFLLKEWDYIHKANTYSAINSTGPLRLLFPSGVFIPTTPQIYFWSFIHVTLSSILWFFFLAGIRKRFKVH